MQRIPRILRGLFKTLFRTGTRVYHHNINVGKYLYDDDDGGEGDDHDDSDNNNNIVT